MKMFLISNSTNYNEPFLEHVKKDIYEFVNIISRKVLFIPFASVTTSFEDYTDKIRFAFSEYPLSFDAITQKENAITKIEEAECIMVGGGNTFHLSKYLQDFKLTDVIKKKVIGGCPFVGWSAGANIVCPTIATTNDMPIVLPNNLFALNLVPFQINPHYTDQSIPNHTGESRVQRITEYLKINKNKYVLGLREGSYIEIKNKQIYLYGKKGAKVFHSDKLPIDYHAGQSLNFLLTQN